MRTNGNQARDYGADKWDERSDFEALLAHSFRFAQAANLNRGSKSVPNLPPDIKGPAKADKPASERAQ